MQVPGGRDISSFESATVRPSTEDGIWLNVLEILATRFILFNQAVAIRKKVLTRIGGFDESLRVLEDMELGLRLALEGPWAFIRQPLVTHQQLFSRSLKNECTETMFHEYNVKIKQQILRKIDADPYLGDLRPLLEPEVRKSMRQLRAVRMKSAGSCATSLLGWGIQQWDRYRDGIYRRTPWFPQMKISTL